MTALSLIFFLVIFLVNLHGGQTEDCTVNNKGAAFKVLNGSRAQPTEYEKNHPSCSCMSKCGDILTDSNGGAIFYKPSAQVQPNERCVWIIRPPQANGFSVNLLHMDNSTNLKGSDVKLIVTTVKWNYGNCDASVVSKGFTSYTPINTGKMKFTEQHTTMLVITFATGSSVQDVVGFALSFKENGKSWYTALSTHHIFDFPTCQFKYPVGRELYANDELASFVFVPSNNIYTGRNSVIWYEQLGLEPKPENDPNWMCCDTLFLYKFIFSADYGTDNWKFVTRFCNDTETYQLVTDDLALLVFETKNYNGGGEGTGFRLYYAPDMSNNAMFV